MFKEIIALTIYFLIVLFFSLFIGKSTITPELVKIERPIISFIFLYIGFILVIISLLKNHKI